MRGQYGVKDNESPEGLRKIQMRQPSLTKAQKAPFLSAPWSVKAKKVGQDHLSHD